ncbi:MAG: hypothetical protein GEU73_14460 [Chloroflexi bacterium]|nr:hypothetical protein [Chloroflexota bacterium]
MREADKIIAVNLWAYFLSALAKLDPEDSQRIRDEIVQGTTHYRADPVGSRLHLRLTGATAMELGSIHRLQILRPLSSPTTN